MLARFGCAMIFRFKPSVDIDPKFGQHHLDTEAKNGAKTADLDHKHSLDNYL